MLRAVWLCIVISLISGAAVAAGALERVAQTGVLKVCIWPNYYSITFRSPRDQQLSGIDIDLSAAFAHDLGAKLEYVDSSFVKFVDDLNADRCDVAMFGVGITEQRKQAVVFPSLILKVEFMVLPREAVDWFAIGMTLTRAVWRWQYRPVPSWSR
jgi:ABC-type amino acid transport substrate-binding protein